MMRTLLLAVAGALWIVGVSAHADTFADRVKALTGIDTAESEALDREISDLIVEYQKAYAKFVAEPVGITKGKLMAEAEAIRKQALERARAAADVRATAINQRCVAPDAGGAPAGEKTSPFLCGAVGSAEPGDTPNDPWIVCGCGRRYIAGLSKEVEAIAGRSQSFAGAIWPVESSWSRDFRFRRSAPLPADLVAGYFESDIIPASDRFIGAVGPRNTISGEGGWSFLGLARSAQERIAQLDVYERTTSTPGGTGQVAFADPVQQESALLVPPVRDAYFQVQEALRWTWLLTQREGALKMAAIEEKLVQAVEQAEKPFFDQQAVIHRAIDSDENSSWLERNAKKREADRRACPGWIAGIMPHVEEAVGAARALVAEVYQARRRFLADAEAWKTFALKDGAGTGPTAGTGRDFNDRDFAQFIAEDLGLSPLPFGSVIPDNPILDSKLEAGWVFWLPGPVSQETFGPFCMWPGFFLSDPIAGYWRPTDLDSPYADPSYGYWLGEEGEAAAAYDAMVLKAAQARFPELEELSGHGGPARLRFDLEAKGQLSEATVSGAGVGQGP